MRHLFQFLGSLIIVFGVASVGLRAEDQFGLFPDKPETIKPLVNAYIAGDMSPFLTTTQDHKGPSYLPLSLMVHYYEDSASPESKKTIVWAFGQMITKYILKSTIEKLSSGLTKNGKEHNQLESFLENLWTVSPGRSRSAITDLLLTARKTAEQEDVAKAALSSISNALSIVALEQGEVGKSNSSSNEHIKQAIDSLYEIGTPEAVEALYSILHQTPGRSDPPRDFNFGFPREELAHMFARERLGALASHHNPVLYSEACAAILRGTLPPIKIGP